MQAPTLFIIAADLTKMQVNANIDEADVGRIRPNQTVTFRVDAYPGEEFQGAVSQIRLQPVVVQNVTTYATIINVPNRELKLKPGMTANLRVQIARRADVLRIANAALRFRPTNEMFAALNQPVPPEAARAAAADAVAVTARQRDGDDAPRPRPSQRQRRGERTAGACVRPIGDSRAPQRCRAAGVQTADSASSTATVAVAAAVRWRRRIWRTRSGRLRR